MRRESQGPSVFQTAGPSPVYHRAGGTEPAHSVHSLAADSVFCIALARLLVQVIEVKFVKLDLEPDSYCRYDYVALFNGGERDNSRRIGKFCGDRVPG